MKHEVYVIFTIRGEASINDPLKKDNVLKYRAYFVIFFAASAIPQGGEALFVLRNPCLLECLVKLSPLSISTSLISTLMEPVLLHGSITAGTEGREVENDELPSGDE